MEDEVKQPTTQEQPRKDYLDEDRFLSDPDLMGYDDWYNGDGYDD